MRHSDGILTLRRVRVHGKRVSGGPGRLSCRAVRYGGAAGWRGREPAGHLVGLGTHQPSGSRAVPGYDPAAAGGGIVSEHADRRTAGGGQDHTAAGDGGSVVQRQRGAGAAACGHRGRAGRVGGDVPGRTAAGCGISHGRAGQLPQGAGHSYADALRQSAGHRRG